MAGLSLCHVGGGKGRAGQGTWSSFQDPTWHLNAWSLTGVSRTIPKTCQLSSHHVITTSWIQNPQKVPWLLFECFPSVCCSNYSHKSCQTTFLQRGNPWKFKDNDDLKAKLQAKGNSAQSPQADFRHSDMEQAHQHILYLETKVRAMDELDSFLGFSYSCFIFWRGLRSSTFSLSTFFWKRYQDYSWCIIIPSEEKRNEDLKRQVKALENQKQGGCEIAWFPIWSHFFDGTTGKWRDCR